MIRPPQHLFCFVRSRWNSSTMFFLSCLWLRVLNPVFTTQGTNLWSELCSQKADWQFSASCFTSCNLFLWFFSFLPSFILLFLSQFFITVTLFFPSFFTFLYLFLLSVFLPCVLLSSFPPSFLLYSQHFIFTLFISFIDFFLLCFFLFVLSSVLLSFKIRFVRKLHYINNYNIISSWILFSKSGFNNGWCLVKCRIDR